MEAVVKYVEPGSIADDLGIVPGDAVCAIDGQPLRDILDYKFLSASDEYTLELKKQDGSAEVIEVVNEDYEELGIAFENGLLDKPRACKNKCMFCFVDQLPRRVMRRTLYFKDDDYRLSALMGNYITLTNLEERDVERIIAMRLPRINISVHAADAAVRSRLLQRKNADVMPLIRRFADAGITMDCQVVLCPGINDGAVLDDTVLRLADFYPRVQSLSVVPVGLTKYREGLPSLELFDKIGAEGLLRQVDGLQARCLERFGSRFVFASDEFYVKAGRALPDEPFYEGYLQIENGVGLLTSLAAEFEAARGTAACAHRKKTIATGVSAAPYLRRMAESVTDAVQVIAVRNDFFGNTITVAGLITGGDLIRQLRGRQLGAEVLIPRVMLNHDLLFLDDLTLRDVETALGVPVVPVENDGFDFMQKICR